VFEQAAWRFVRLAGGHVNQQLHFCAGEFSAVARDVVVLFHDFHGVVDVILVAFDAQAIVVEVGTDVERVFEQAHIFIQGAEEGFNLSGNVNGTPHSEGKLACGGSDVGDGEVLFGND
jgi:hypothetical protein